MSLSEMTLDELWQLFPIFLTAHSDEWNDWYNEELGNIRRLLPYKELKINHIGSTAINGIWAKPIVDFLIESPQEIPLTRLKNRLTDAGYICMSEDEKRISLNKGYTENGFAPRVFHFHLRYYGDNDELYFRDYMNNHADAACEYEALKLSLWKKFEHDRDGYTNAKGDFIRRYTLRALSEYGDVYK